MGESKRQRETETKEEKERGNEGGRGREIKGGVLSTFADVATILSSSPLGC